MDVDLQDLPPVGDHIVRQHIGFSSLGNQLLTRYTEINRENNKYLSKTFKEALERE